MWFVVLSSFLACQPEFASVDEACPDRLFGERAAPDGAVEAAQRVMCYRRFVGLKKVDVDADLVEANIAHARYLFENEDALEGDVWGETSGLPGFTGTDLDARTVAASYVLPQQSFGSFDLIGYRSDPGLPPAELVDYWMEDPLFRQFFLQPAMMDFGYGAHNTWVEMSGYYAWPPDEHAWAPVVYPVADQRGVPSTWQSWAGWQVINEDLPERAEFGFPITLHFGSNEAGSIGNDNALQIQVDADAPLTVTGPDGPIDLFTVLPATSAGELPTSISLIPMDPLEPGASYTVAGTVSWGSRSAELEWTFTVAP